MGLNTGEILLVAGKGHEKTQDYGKKKIFFSDQEVILESIKSKNKFLSKNFKLNIIKEEAKSKISNKLVIKNISINSKSIKKMMFSLLSKVKTEMVINMFQKLLKKNQV